MTTTTLDQHFGTVSQGYRLTRTDRIGEHTVRVRVHVDNRASQSFALAEVLTPALTWTELAEDLPAGWFDSVPSYAESRIPATCLDDIAARLLRRAAVILGVQQPTTARNTRIGRALIGT